MNALDNLPRSVALAGLLLASTQLEASCSPPHPTPTHPLTHPPHTIPHPTPIRAAEPLLADNSAPPQPYDPASVRSVVRWGTMSGNLTMETQQDHRVVYTYVYGPGEQGRGARGKAAGIR